MTSMAGTHSSRRDRWELDPWRGCRTEWRVVAKCMPALWLAGQTAPGLSNDLYRTRMKTPSPAAARLIQKLSMTQTAVDLASSCARYCNRDSDSSFAIQTTLLTFWAYW